MPTVFYEQDDVILYVTEACNSNCVMCPMSAASRKRGFSLTQEQWEQVDGAIPADAQHVTITGGEPFLEYRKVLPVMKHIAETRPEAEVLVLTNGRAFSLDFITAEMLPFLTDRFTFAIPVHGPEAGLHDRITQAEGSFAETMAGIRKIAKSPARIEIRIVAHRLNLDALNDTIRMLVDSKIRISVINIIAMEMTGCAAANREKLWVDYDEICRRVYPGIQYAILHQTDMGLYNFPLCCVPKELWGIAKNSISYSKVRYYEECGKCQEYKACGGLFKSTMQLKLCRVTPF